MNKQKITRFTVLPDDRNLMLGIDNAELFESGMVYEVFEMLDEIIIRKVGKCAMSEKGKYPCLNGSDANSIITDGRHLATKEEVERIN